ncbi:MAG: GNAT family N-acetyltransferase [Candidatus Shapirobacteria bacterium]|nr:GNAT family N-acetyltransferase [Candidatus Shapirobacteria bacterium]MDD4410155.1 GNAT family N-acetyltransferase [Candidatus Shapirobacteria bacterium]
MTEDLISNFNILPDLHQNPRFAKAMVDIGWTIMGNPGKYLFIRNVGPLSVAKIQHSNSIDFDLLKKIRQKYHTLTTYIEPGLLHPDIQKKGLSVEPFANSATSLVDLTLSTTDLLNSFKSKTRYNISYAKRKNDLKIITKDFHDLTASDFDIFKISRESWSKRKKVVCYEGKFFNALIKHFSHSGWVHFAYHQDKCVGTLMILKNGKAAIYYAAFAENLGYSLFAPTLLTWTAMTTAKEAGCHIFDFGGIYDPRYKMYKKWIGFTKFKEGFSPTVIYYPPTQLFIGW